MILTPILHSVFKAPEKKGVILEQFNRTNSVRDRMRKFTESSQSSNVPALKKAPGVAAGIPVPGRKPRRGPGFGPGQVWGATPGAAMHVSSVGKTPLLGTADSHA